MVTERRILDLFSTGGDNPLKPRSSRKARQDVERKSVPDRFPRTSATLADRKKLRKRRLNGSAAHRGRPSSHVQVKRGDSRVTRTVQTVDTRPLHRSAG